MQTTEISSDNETTLELEADKWEEETETTEEADICSQLSNDEMVQAISTMLFMSEKPLSLPKIRALLVDSGAASDIEVKIVRGLLQELKENLERLPLGFELVEVAMGWQFRTRPKCGRFISKEIRTQTIKLSPTSLEVLSLIAYRQPISKPEVDELRGVDTSHLLRVLMEKNLVKICGRSEGVGKPALYGTTPEFLELLGIPDLTGLPSRLEIESMVPENVAGLDPEEEQVSHIRALVKEKKPEYLEETPEREAQDELFLNQLRSELEHISTSSLTLDLEHRRTKIRLNFEKKKSSKRRDLLETGMGDADVESYLLLNGFSDEDLNRLLESAEAELRSAAAEKSHPENSNTTQ